MGIELRAILPALLLCSGSVVAKEQCGPETGLRQVQLELTEVRSVQKAGFKLWEAEFEVKNSGSKKIQMAVSAYDATLRIYTGSFGYQAEFEPGRWENIAMNLDDSMAPNTIIELRHGAVVRFVQDTSDASGVAARGKAKRAWVKDEVSGCKFYSLPFSLPAAD